MPRPSWDIAVPAGPGLLHGLRMAGFSDRATELRNLQLIPHPSVTLVFNLGGTPVSVEDGAGRRGCERTVVGLAPDTVRARGERGFACLQLRLSPMLAHAVLGPPGGPYGEAVDLDALWGRAAAERLQDRLRAAGVVAGSIPSATITRMLSVFTIGLINAPAALGATAPQELTDAVTLFADLVGDGLAGDGPVDTAAARSAQLDLLDQLSDQLTQLEEPR